MVQATYDEEGGDANLWLVHTGCRTVEAAGGVGEVVCESSLTMGVDGAGHVEETRGEGKGAEGGGGCGGED